MDLEKTNEYIVRVGNLERTVQLVPISDTTAIAYLDFLCDRELVEATAQALADALGPLDVQCVVAPEVGAIPLCYMVSSRLGVRHVILRKLIRGYMGPTHSAQVRSAAASTQESLLVEDRYLPLLKSSRVALLDTVTTTGSTFKAMTSLMDAQAVNVVARAVAFVEGDLIDAHDYVFLGRLPVFQWRAGIDTRDVGA
jgi:adenine phosphoribosyltransferase